MCVCVYVSTCVCIFVCYVSVYVFACRCVRDRDMLTKRETCSQRERLTQRAGETKLSYDLPPSQSSAVWSLFRLLFSLRRQASAEGLIFRLGVWISLSSSLGISLLLSFSLFTSLYFTLTLNFSFSTPPPLSLSVCMCVYIYIYNILFISVLSKMTNKY